MRIQEREYDLEKPLDCVRLIARERYAWPGGYEIVAVCADGGVLCSQCVRDNYRQVFESTRDHERDRGYCDGWSVAGYMTNDWIEESTPCDHCGRELSAYIDKEE